jgi:coenzyme PQQ precursor peptide PqqA
MSLESSYPHEEARTMTWETPEFSEVRMDAELTAYADDLDGI